MYRITGRPELAHGQTIMPWKYAEKFEMQKVPGDIQKVIQEIRKNTREELGEVRDVTINYRELCKY